MSEGDLETLLAIKRPERMPTYESVQTGHPNPVALDYHVNAITGNTSERIGLDY